MIFIASLLLAVSTQSAALPPAPVADVVAAASKCFESVSRGAIDTSVLVKAGWVEQTELNGKPAPAGGRAFRHEGVSGEIAVVGPVCSLVAPVATFDDVQAVLLAVDDVVGPDRIEEVKEGILLKKGNRELLFWVGSPSNRTPAAVRIDVRNSETR